MTRNQIGYRSSLNILASLLLPFILTTCTYSMSEERDISIHELIAPFISDPRLFQSSNPSELCHDSLVAADSNRDGIVQSFEYPRFIADLSAGEIDVGDYSDLPFMIKLNLVFLSCYCLMEGRWNCCKGAEGGIYTNGAQPNDTPTKSELAYLERVCTDSQGAIDYSINEISPTNIPTEVAKTRSPVIPSRTKAPTASPFLSATSFFPTKDVPLASKLPLTVEIGQCVYTLHDTGSPSNGSDLSICISTANETTISLLKNVTAIYSNGMLKELIDDEGVLGSFTSIQGLGTSFVTLSLNNSLDSPAEDLLIVEASGFVTLSNGIKETDSFFEIDFILNSSLNTLPPLTFPSMSSAPSPFGFSSWNSTIQPGESHTLSPQLFPTTSLSYSPTSVTIITVEPSYGNLSGVPNNPSSIDSIVYTKVGPCNDTALEDTSYVIGDSMTICISVAAENVITSLTNVKVISSLGVVTELIDNFGETNIATKVQGIGTSSVLLETLNTSSYNGNDVNAGSGSMFNITGFAKVTNGLDEKEFLFENVVLFAAFIDTLYPKDTGNGSFVRNKSQSDYLTAGSIVGVVIASVAVVYISLFLIGRYKERDQDKNPALHDVTNNDNKPLQAILPRNSWEFKNNDSESPKAGLLKSLLLLEEHSPKMVSPCSSIDPDMKSISQDESSSAGASGWSSSAGLSSLHTFDTLTDDEMLPETKSSTLIAVGAASIITHTVSVGHSQPGPLFVRLPCSQGANELLKSRKAKASDREKVSRDDLNAAIEAGDWSLVGSTAALLASSDDSLFSTKQGSVDSKDSAFGSSNSDFGKMQKLIEAGDWHGVIRAAGMIEGASDSESLNESMEHLVNFNTKPSVSESHDEKTRAEVLALVKCVVPDEIDHIDEMLLQFKNREEELIETLKIMQERSLARRAQSAIEKSVKLEAKEKAVCIEASFTTTIMHISATSDSSSSDAQFYDSDTSSLTDLEAEDNFSTSDMNESPVKTSTP